MLDKEFAEFMRKVKENDIESIEKLISMFTPLIKKYSYINSQYDEDLNAELIYTLIKQAKKYNVNEG